jgi:hypothetical protein
VDQLHATHATPWPIVPDSGSKAVASRGGNQGRSGASRRRPRSRQGGRPADQSAVSRARSKREALTPSTHLCGHARAGLYACSRVPICRPEALTHMMGLGRLSDGGSVRSIARNWGPSPAAGPPPTHGSPEVKSSTLKKSTPTVSSRSLAGPSSGLRRPEDERRHSWPTRGVRAYAGTEATERDGLSSLSTSQPYGPDLAAS